ncbi:hypothetical protein TNCV_783921 [Trichonephila clavipes]|nr:hypothetical protein TNCV_783921 [Trichonephila clavipes]
MKGTLLPNFKSVPEISECGIEWMSESLSPFTYFDSRSSGIVVSGLSLYRWVWVRIPEKVLIFVNVKCLRDMGGTLNSRRAASSLVGLVEGEVKWEAPDTPGCSPSKLGWKRVKSHFYLHGAQSYG